MVHIFNGAVGILAIVVGLYHLTNIEDFPIMSLIFAFIMFALGIWNISLAFGV